MPETELKKPMNELVIFQERFNVHLKSFLDAKANAISSYTKNPFILDNINHGNEITLGPGKRLRPYIAFLMYKSLGGQDDVKVLKLLVGLEIFHSSALAHDDIIDEGKLRHGVETSHIYIARKLEQEEGRGDSTHIDSTQAILVGDIQHAWSQEIIGLNSDFDPEKMARIRRLFHEMVEEATIGQMLDEDIKTRDIVSEEDIHEKTRIKTAGYSFIKPLQIGAALAGNKTEEIEEFCQEFGLRMGIAFQTQDDLLDITSNDSELGKTSSSDKSQNQHTYFTYFKSPEVGKELIAKNFQEARDLVRTLSINEDAKKKFFNLIEAIEKRRS